MNRVHTLLKQNDTQYQEMLAAAPEFAQGKFFFDNLKRMMQKTLRLANLGRAAQAIQAYGSFDPQSLQVLSAENAIIQALIDSDLPMLVKPQDQVQTERAGFAEAAQAQDQQAMQMEQQKLQPAMQANDIKAAEVAMKAQEQQGGEEEL